MSRLAYSLTELIGDTPMLIPRRYCEEEGVRARLMLKLEPFNPLGSVKDRVALAMLRDAEQKGQLKPGSTVIEATSGSAGISLAFVGAALGYHVIITMPDTVSPERRNLLKALGAETVLTPAIDGMNGAIRKAEEMGKKIPGSYLPSQFTNEVNPEVHRRTTAQEILATAGEKIDFFVAGVGTGGTLTGIGEVLKQHNPDITIVAVEPASSPVLSGGHRGSHHLQGIGAGFKPPVLNTKLYKEVFPVRDDEAFEACRRIAHAEGLLLGASSGAALYAATQLGKRAENRDKTIVAVMPDTGERYLSSPVFD